MEAGSITSIAQNPAQYEAQLVDWADKALKDKRNKQHNHGMHSHTQHASAYTAPYSLAGQPTPITVQQLGDWHEHGCQFYSPPPGLVNMTLEANAGLPQISIDNELIQCGETRFFPVPINAALPFIIKALEDREHSEQMGRSKLLLAGHAFKINVLERGSPWSEAGGDASKGIRGESSWGSEIAPG